MRTPGGKKASGSNGGHRRHPSAEAATKSGGTGRSAEGAASVISAADWCWFGAAILIAAFFAFWNLGLESLWFDEAWSIRLASRPLIETFTEYVRSNAEGPPLFFVLLHGWMKLFGSSEVSVRVLPAFFHVAAVAAHFFCIRLLTGTRTAALSAILVATAPALLFFSHDARNYSLVVFLFSLSLWLFIRHLRFRSTGSLVAVTLANMAGILTHVLSFEVVLLENIAMLVFVRNRAALAKWFTAQLLLLACALPYFFLIGAAGTAGQWVPPPNLRSMFNALLLYTGGRVLDVPFAARLAGWEESPVGQFLLLAGLTLAAIGTVTVVAGRRSGAESHDPGAARLFLPGQVLLALLVPLILIPFGVGFFIPRYLIMGIPAFLALQTIGARTVLRRPSLTPIPVMLMAGAQMVVAVGLLSIPLKDDWREVGRAMSESVQPNDTIIVSDGRAIVPFEYYYRGPGQPVAMDGLLGTVETDGPAIESRLESLNDRRGVLWLVMPWGGAVNDGRVGLWVYLDSEPDRFKLVGHWLIPGSWGGIRVHCYRLPGRG